MSRPSAKACPCEPSERAAPRRIEAAIVVIGQHLARGDLSDGLVFDAVRVRLNEIGEAVKGIDATLLDLEPELPWSDIAGMRDHLAHRYFDTGHAMVGANRDAGSPTPARGSAAPAGASLNSSELVPHRLVAA